MKWVLPILLAAASAAFASEVLRVCDDVKDPMTLDPHKEFSEKNHTIVQQIFEGLVRFGPDGEILPALATRWRRLDDKTIQFDLRRGVVFHDGTPFQADSVKFSIERYLDPETGFPAFGYINSLARVDIVDDYKVNIVTHNPDGLLLNRLAGFIVIVPEKHYRNTPPESLKDGPVGTGAFRMRAWERGKELLLVKNEKYWDSTLPKVDQLIFKFLPAEEQVDALLDGHIDILTNVPGTRTLEVKSNPSTSILKKPSLYTMAGNFNTSRKPLADPKVRQAINLAVNKSDLIRYDIFGNGIPIGTLSMDGEFGHNKNLRPYPFDPEKARALMKEAGYPEGFELNVLLKANAARTGRIIARQLKNIDVRLKFTLVTDSELFEFLKKRDKWDMAIYSCPDPMHHAFFIPSIFVAGGSPFSLASAEGIDTRMAAIVKALDPESQRKAAEDLGAYIYSNFLALPTYQRMGVYGLRKGVRFTPYKSGMPYFLGVSIDDD